MFLFVNCYHDPWMISWNHCSQIVLKLLWMFLHLSYTVLIEKSLKLALRVEYSKYVLMFCCSRLRLIGRRFRRKWRWNIRRKESDQLQPPLTALLVLNNVTLRCETLLGLVCHSVHSICILVMDFGVYFSVMFSHSFYLSLRYNFISSTSLVLYIFFLRNDVWKWLMFSEKLSRVCSIPHMIFPAQRHCYCNCDSEIPLE